MLVLLLSLTAAAELRWEATTVDFGTIREDEGRATRHFHFRNVGDSAVDITRIRTSCGCTSSDYVRHGIQPGEADSMPIHYNPIRRPGSFNKLIHLTASDSTYTLHNSLGSHPRRPISSFYRRTAHVCQRRSLRRRHLRKKSQRTYFRLQHQQRHISARL